MADQRRACQVPGGDLPRRSFHPGNDGASGQGRLFPDRLILRGNIKAELMSTSLTWNQSLAEARSELLRQYAGHQPGFRMTRPRRLLIRAVSHDGLACGDVFTLSCVSRRLPAKKNTSTSSTRSACDFRPRHTRSPSQPHPPPDLALHTHLGLKPLAGTTTPYLRQAQRGRASKFHSGRRRPRPAQRLGSPP